MHQQTWTARGYAFLLFFGCSGDPAAPKEHHGETDEEGSDSVDSVDSVDSMGSTDSADTADIDPVNQFLNPSFETWTSANEPNQTPDDWVNFSSDGGLAFDAVPDSCSAEPSTAADGNRFARAYNGEGVCQTLETESSQSYQIAFEYTSINGCFGGRSNSEWQVWVDGEIVHTTPANLNSWTSAEVDFVAASGTTEVCFRKTTGQGGLDQLSVMRVDD